MNIFFRRAVSRFRYSYYLYFYYIGFKLTLNTMTCIASVEKLLPLCSRKKLESLVQNFLCIICFHIGKLFEKAETKHFKLVISSVFGMQQRLPHEKFRNFRHYKTNEICDSTHFCSENPAFFKSMFVDIIFNLSISFRPNSNHNLEIWIEKILRRW